MRYALYPFLIALLLIALFEGVFRFAKHKFERGGTPRQERVAEGLKLYLFKNDRLVWRVEGEKADFSEPAVIYLEKFSARRAGRYLSIAADRAEFHKYKAVAYLAGHVVIEFLHGGQKVRIETDRATVDFRRRVVFGDGKVVVREPGRMLVGRGFRYDMRNNRFIILRDVQTYFVAP